MYSSFVESMVESTTTPSQPLPQVSKDVKIEINADLKGMFAPSVLKGNIDNSKMIFVYGHLNEILLYYSCNSFFAFWWEYGERGMRRCSNGRFEE